MRRDDNRHLRERHGGIELYRSIMMLLVVLCHICCLPKPDGAVLLPLAISLIGVPGFISISGWFGIRFTWRKWFAIWCCMAFYGVLAYFCSGGAEDAKILISGGWFVAPYLVLMMLSPIVNAGVNIGCRHGKYRDLLIMVIFLLCVTWIASWPFEWSKRFIGMRCADFGRKSFFCMLLIYMIARIVSQSDCVRHLSRARIGWLLLVAWLFFLAQVAVFRFVIFGGRPVENVWKILPYCGYNSVFVVAVALVTLLLFCQFQLPERLGRVLTFVNRSLLSVYIIHNCTAVGRKVLCKQLYENVYLFTNRNQLLAIAITVLAVFIFCIAIDMLVRRMPLAIARIVIAKVRRSC